VTSLAALDTTADMENAIMPNKPNITDAPILELVEQWLVALGDQAAGAAIGQDLQASPSTISWPV
jgi:hypothetical protein